MNTAANLRQSLRELIIYDPELDGHHVPGVFMVRAVEKRGSKRAVTLDEIGGERIEILISPPAPPIHAIAISRGVEIHWYAPATGSRGKNLVWQKA